MGCSSSKTSVGGSTGLPKYPPEGPPGLRNPEHHKFIGDRTTDLKVVFMMVDFDKNGTLDSAELARLSKLDGAETSELQARVFEETDTNHDGKIDVNEFVKYNLEHTKDLSYDDFKERMQQWVAIVADIVKARAFSANFFGTVDTNNDGVIDKEEAKGKISDEDFKAADANADGVLTPEELADFQEKKHLAEKAAAAKPAE